MSIYQQKHVILLMLLMPFHLEFASIIRHNTRNIRLNNNIDPKPSLITPHGR
jgi:hypothetical protein